MAIVEDAAKYVVETNDISMMKFALVFKSCGIRIAYMAIIIPFNVGNIRLLKYLTNRFDDIIANLRSTKIENVLISA